MGLWDRTQPTAVTPSARRSRIARGLTAAAASGRFELQVCVACGTTQYPPREACSRCLSNELEWTPQSGAGQLLSKTVLHHSHDPYFQSRLPWFVGLVKLDAGPSVLVHLPADAPAPPARVWVRARLDRGGAGVLVASERDTDDGWLQEMSSEPAEANVLVTDGGSLHAEAIVRALALAGAARIWVCFRDTNGLVAPALRDLPQVTGLRMDVTDEVGVRAAAAAIGHDIDILINTSALSRAAMETHYFGLFNLARHFLEPLGERAAHCGRMCPAWVNILSVSGLSDDQPWGTFGASMAAARSVSQSMRPQLREKGVRLVNVYPGPLDDEGGREPHLPKLSPLTLSKGIVDALRSGIEDVFPGEVAQAWLAGEQT